MNLQLSPRALEIAEHTKVLLAAGGYNGFSYADLSERVRIGKPSIHHHFPSKAELVLTVVALHRQEARKGLAALDSHIADPLARLKAYTSYWSGCIHDGTAPLCICAMLAAELPMIPQDIAHEVSGYFEDLSAWIESVMAQGVTTGQFHLTESTAAAAQLFMSTMHGAMLTARAFNNPQAFDAIADAAVGRLIAA